MEVMNGKKVTVGNKIYYEFITSHFSDFALVDADEAGIKVVDTLTADEVKSIVKDMKLKVTTKALKKSIRVNIKADKETLMNLKDSGYTVKYKFYRSLKKNKGYKAMFRKEEASTPILRLRRVRPITIKLASWYMMVMVS